MAKRRRRRRPQSRREPKLWQKKVTDLTALAVTGLVTYGLYRHDMPKALWPVIAISALGLWWLVLIPTYCDSVLRSDPSKLCTRRVRGKLRGCEDHARDKRDAVFGLLNLQNPGVLFRVGWGTTGTLPAYTKAQAAAASNATRDTWMFIFTALSTAAGVAGAAFTVMFAN